MKNKFKRMSIITTAILMLSLLIGTGIALATPTVVDGFTIEPFATGLNGPFGLAFDGEGNLYVANEDGFDFTERAHTVSKITPDSVVSTFADGFEGPAGLAFDSQGNLYVSDDTGRVLKVTPQGAKSVFAENMGNPNALAFDDAGNLYVADIALRGNPIHKITPTGVVSTFVAEGSTQALVFDDAGNLFLTQSDKIFKVRPDGDVSSFATFSGGTQGGLAFDKNGNLYVSTTDALTVYKITPDGKISPFVTGFSPALDNYPRGLAFDTEDNLYVTEFGTGIVWRITSGYTPAPTPAPTSTPTPTSASTASSSLWIDRGNTYVEVGRYQDAIDAYDKAIEIDPYNADAWMSKAGALNCLGRYQDALDAVDKVIELDPNNAHAWTLKGALLNDLGRCQEALDALEKAIELNPDNLDAWFHKGGALGCLGKDQEATAMAQEVIDMCDKLIAVNPNDIGAWHYKGSELNALGKNEEALVALNKALELDPTNPHTWCVKGNALFALGRYQEAVDAYDKATKRNPNYPHFWVDKAKALDALGKHEEADEAYDIALGISTIPTPTPEKTSTLISPPSAPIPPLYVIGAAVIVIILIAGIGISRKGKKGESAKPKPPAEPQPPAEPPKPKKEPAKSEPTVEPAPTKEEPDINITSAFGYRGATIVHKIKVENSTPETVGDIKIRLFVPDVFLLKEQEKHIGLLKPNESKTVTFEIRPTGECGDCEVSGRVTYYDYASKKTKEVDIPVKTLSIVCPLLRLKKIDEDTWRSVVSELAKAEESTKKIDMPAKTLFEVTSDILRDMNMFLLPPSVTETPQLYRATARFYAEGVKEFKYAAQIEVVGGAKKSKLILKAWAEKEEALTGFYHGILDEIEKRVQVKGYIDDSIVQYNIGHIGDRIGTIVKDSVVQRSTIGAGAVKKCPGCGREVSEDEWFCPHCGDQLK